MRAADVPSCCLMLVTSETLPLRNPRIEEVTRAACKLPANKLLIRSLLKETGRNLRAGNSGSFFSSLLLFGAFT